MTEKFAVTPWNSRSLYNFSCISLHVSTCYAHGNGNEPISTPSFSPWACTIYASLIAFRRQGNKDSEQVRDTPGAGARASRSHSRRSSPGAWYGASALHHSGHPGKSPTPHGPRVYPHLPRVTVTMVTERIHTLRLPTAIGQHPGPSKACWARGSLDFEGPWNEAHFSNTGCFIWATSHSIRIVPTEGMISKSHGNCMTEKFSKVILNMNSISSDSL